MNLFAKIIIAAFFLCLNVSNSQTRLPGQWSIMLNGNLEGNFGASEAMNGSKDEFLSDVSVDYNNRKYPFGDEATKSGNIGFMLSYRLVDNPLSFNFGVNNYYFYLQSDGFFSENKALMNIMSFTPGIEYTYGETSQLWNVFGRLGLNFNIIWGKTEYFIITEVIPTFRLGGELELGGRLNIPSTPLAIELSAAYVNANLIGKSYTRFSERPPQELDKRELNDGKNPDNPDDVNRNIGFITLKAGIRLWF